MKTRFYLLIPACIALLGANAAHGATMSQKNMEVQFTNKTATTVEYVKAEFRFEGTNTLSDNPVLYAYVRKTNIKPGQTVVLSADKAVRRKMTDLMSYFTELRDISIVKLKAKIFKDPKHASWELKDKSGSHEKTFAIVREKDQGWGKYDIIPGTDARARVTQVKKFVTMPEPKKTWKKHAPKRIPAVAQSA